MMDSSAKVIYVGKANNLKKRVASYFTRQELSPKTKLLVEKICDIDVLLTETENDALLLENNLIKKLKPRYNVLLRDDKSYPYLYISSQHDFPRLDIYRGQRKPEGKSFGPYPSAGAVRETLNLLQKIFRIRSCNDTFFKNRSRPCLQYQIDRCTAPCVNYISKEKYSESVRMAELFLSGRNQQVIAEFVKHMEKACTQLDYEQAGIYRDQIAALRRVQQQQYIDKDSVDIDVIAIVSESAWACVHVLNIRGGRVIGGKSHFLQIPLSQTPDEVLEAFLLQYYLNSTHQESIPKDFLLNRDLDNKNTLADFFTKQIKSKIQIRTRVRGERLQWLQMATNNAMTGLNGHLASRANIYRRFEALQTLLKIESIPQRLECFDVSHTVGEATVASCVVFDSNGPLKTDYRRFNIGNITPGDDYAAMNQALSRRYTRVKKQDGKLPDVLFIDGGKGQLRQAEEVFEELQISGVLLVGVAKGADRKSGTETLFIAGNKNPIHCPADSIGFHLIQQIRDEAHRFAITGHRQRRDKKRSASTLEDIPGIGAKRRKVLLSYFGGLQGLTRASVEEITKVPGISKKSARIIYDSLH